jgi:hypothetical protein
LWVFGERRWGDAELAQALATGARLVAFEYCISFLVVTLRRTSRPLLLRPEQRTLLRSLPYSTVSLLFGWWGMPWGPVLTIMTILTNFTGGRDLTITFRQELERAH